MQTIHFYWGIVSLHNNNHSQNLFLVFMNCSITAHPKKKTRKRSVRECNTNNRFKLIQANFSITARYLMAALALHREMTLTKYLERQKKEKNDSANLCRLIISVPRLMIIAFQ